MLNKNISGIKHFNSNIFIKNYDNNICLLIDNNINTQHKFIIFKTNNNIKYNEIQPLCSFNNKLILDNYALDILSKINWETSEIEITKYSLESLHICLFNYNNIWYIAYCPDILVKIIDTNDKIVEIFLSLYEKNIDLLDTQYVYHLLIKHNDFRKIGYTTDKYKPCITLLWVTLINTNKIIKISDIQTEILFDIEKTYNFNSYDDFTLSLDNMSNKDITNKRLSYGGYYIRIKEDDNYKCLFTRTLIYKHIITSIPNNKNKHVNYLELYQNNKLSEIIPYLHKYSTDIVRRINNAMKILSKELLNIYHSTRKKQNNILYNILLQSYKKVLYDLHKIYVNQKLEEYINVSDSILKEKKSISVDIVYNYLKKISISELLQIFIDRKTLSNTLKQNNYDIINTILINNIDIITLIELMTI